VPFASPQFSIVSVLHLVGGNLPNGEPVGELGFWVRSRRYRDRATENLHLAETAPSFDVRQRYFKVARHYLHMAELEERDAKRSVDKAASPRADESTVPSANQTAPTADQSAPAVAQIAPVADQIAPPAEPSAEPTERAA
jgi:hypothetical protein